MGGRRRAEASKLASRERRAERRAREGRGAVRAPLASAAASAGNLDPGRGRVCVKSGWEALLIFQRRGRQFDLQSANIKVAGTPAR